MGVVLVDSNVILDVLTEDARWWAWSAEALAQAAERDVLVINPIIYAEVSVRFERIEELEEALSPTLFRRDPSPGRPVSWPASASSPTDDGAAHVAHPFRTSTWAPTLPCGQ